MAVFGLTEYLGSMPLDEWCALMELNPAWVDELAASAAREIPIASGGTWAR
jgi:hypothetical protein